MNYTDIQRVVNLAHGNGILENQIDYENARRTCLDIQHNHPHAREVLEVGCRLGMATSAIARQFKDCDVTGVDVVPEFINIANIRSAELANVEHLAHDMHDPLPDSTKYDYVFSAGVFEHFHTPTVAVKNIMAATSGRFVHEIDLCPADRNPSHYTARSNPEFWLNLIDVPDARWVLYANTVIIEGWTTS